MCFGVLRCASVRGCGLDVDAPTPRHHAEGEPSATGGQGLWHGLLTSIALTAGQTRCWFPRAAELGGGPRSGFAGRGAGLHQTRRENANQGRAPRDPGWFGWGTQTIHGSPSSPRQTKRAARGRSFRDLSSTISVFGCSVGDNLVFQRFAGGEAHILCLGD